MKQMSNTMVRLSCAALLAVLAALALSPAATATAVVTVAATTAVTTTEPVSSTLSVTTTITDLGNNIFAVDGRSGGLPNLLSEQEVQTIAKLQSVPLGPDYKILSPVSPDDQAVLARTGGDKVYFVNLRDGGVTPVQVERLTPLTNYVWLDDNTLGFLTTDPTSKANTTLGAGIDRRTGKVSYGEPQLAAIAALGSSTQVVAIIAPNLNKVLLIDSSEAKPPPAFQLPEPGLGALADPSRIGGGLAGGYGILPPNDTFLFSEGTKLRVVDVETGESHDVMQLGANPKVLDVSFSLDGNKFSVTSMWIEWNRILRATGGPRLTDITYQDVTGALPPEENPYLQQNMVTILDFPSGEVSTLRAADGDGVFYGGASWSPDGQTLMVKAQKPGRAEGRRYPQYYPQFHSGGSLRFFDGQLDEVGRIERPEIDSSQLGGRFVSPDEVVIETRVGANGHPYYYNLRTREFRNIADRAGVFFQVTPTNQSSEIVFVFSSYTTPPEFHRIGLDGTGDTRLTNFNEEARTVSQTEQYPVSFTLIDGSTWEGVLILPADTPFPPKNLPIIVWQEGGPTSVVSNSWHATVESPQALLPNFGFGVLVVPLHGRYGVGPEAFDGLADGNNFGQVDIDAQAEIAEQLRERGWASKVGISGCSYGGYFVIQSLTAHPETYDAGHAMCTLTDLIVEWNTGDGILAPWAFGQTPWEILDEYRLDSPIYQAQRVRTPLLAFHGTKDFLPVDLMRNFMLQVSNNDVPAKMLIFQDADHGFGRTAATLAAPYELYGAQEQILWFRQYLEVQP